MVIRGLSAFRPAKCDWRYFAIIGLCAFLQTATADASRSDLSRPNPFYDTAEKSTREIRIKRLRPADPESTEVMLAARGLASSDHCVS